MPLDNVTVCKQETDNLLIIRINSNFDVETASQFKRAFQAEKLQHYIIDFKGCSGMDSTGIGLLLSMRNYVGPEAKIEIINCQPPI